MVNRIPKTGKDVAMTDEMDQEFDVGPFDMEMNLCLCGRDPASGEVRAEVVKAMTLGVRFGLIPGGCLRDVAAAFDDIFTALMPVEARDLGQLMEEIAENMAGIAVDTDVPPEAGLTGARLH